LFKAANARSFIAVPCSNPADTLLVTAHNTQKLLIKNQKRYLEMNCPETSLWASNEKYGEDLFTKQASGYGPEGHRGQGTKKCPFVVGRLGPWQA
jgi:hypothetical protein